MCVRDIKILNTTHSSRIREMMFCDGIGDLKTRLPLTRLRNFVFTSRRPALPERRVCAKPSRTTVSIATVDAARLRSIKLLVRNSGVLRTSGH